MRKYIILVLVALVSLNCTLPVVVPVSMTAEATQTAVTPTNTEDAPLTVTPLTFVTVTAVQALNIRSGPGKQYPTVRDEPLPNGASLIYLGNCQHTDSGWWLKIRYDDLEGYVNQKYVSEQVCK